MALFKKRFWLVFPTGVFPNPKPVFLAIFYYPKPGFFLLPETRVFQKTWNCCCIQILVFVTTLKLQIGACSGQISTFELWTIIMRHEVRVLLVDHRTFVVGPSMFSFSWPIQMDRDVVLHITGVYANFCLFAHLIK